MNQKVMGMSLNSGGHLTHGYRHNISSKMMQAVCYEINPKTGLLDYQLIAEQARREKPTIYSQGYFGLPSPHQFTRRCAKLPMVWHVFMRWIWPILPVWLPGKVFTGDFDPIPHAPSCHLRQRKHCADQGEEW